MSTYEILSHIEPLPLPEKIALVETILRSIKAQVEAPEAQKKAEARREEIHQRRQDFKVRGFHLGGEVVVDRDEMYSERGM